MQSLNQFNKLDKDLRHKIALRVAIRITESISPIKNINSKILIVGDKPAPSTKEEARINCIPFAAFWHSSLFLNIKLEEANIPESNLAWVNARDFDDNPTSYNVFPDWKWKKIIALGGVAEKWVKKAGLECSTVPHPSYWKRFHSKEPYPLIQVLKDLL